MLATGDEAFLERKRFEDHGDVDRVEAIEPRAQLGKRLHGGSSGVAIRRAQMREPLLNLVQAVLQILDVQPRGLNVHGAARASSASTVWLRPPALAR
jgi:hypothetical protein